MKIIKGEKMFEPQNKEVREPSEIFNNLVSRWHKQKDSEGKRLVTKIERLYAQSNPLLEAVLKNDKALFEARIGKSDSLLFWFEVSCLCGSEVIIGYLLNEEKIKNEDLINAPAYALSTGDKNFTSNLSYCLKTRGQKQAGNVFLYSKDYLFANTITNIFEDDSSSEFSINTERVNF